ncbi:MAG: NUDIX hydrolase [Oscillospiraceae bacterium]|nr:NUDIX hydrolase [Oscillospiraceae bacterium]
MEKFKLVSKEIIKDDKNFLKTPRMSCVRVSYKGNKGTIMNHIVVESVPSVAVLVFNQNREIAFIKQFRSATGNYYIEVPAGLKEPFDSSMVDTAIREVKEETGLEIKNAKILDLSPNLLDIGKSNEECGIAIAEVGSQGERKLDEVEAIDDEIIWISEAEVKENLLKSIINGVPFYKELYLSGHTKNSLLVYFFVK